MATADPSMHDANSDPDYRVYRAFQDLSNWLRERSSECQRPAKNDACHHDEETIMCSVMATAYRISRAEVDVRASRAKQAFEATRFQTTWMRRPIPEEGETDGD